MPPGRHDEFYEEGFLAPSPAEIEAVKQKEGAIHSWAGVTVVRLSSDMIVKHGSHVSIAEARTMLFVAQNTKNVPIPRIYGHYTFGPFDRDVDDYGSLYDTYLFMGFADGTTLEKSWDSYDQAAKANIASQLKNHVAEIRNIPSVPWIGSVDRGAVNDFFLERLEHKGPFESEEDFNTALIHACCKTVPKQHIRSFLSGMLSERQHSITFMHGDLRPANIIAKDGIVTGIVDWEYSEWFPEYWEFARAFAIWRWQNDWTDHLLTILSPYYADYGAYSFLARYLTI